MASSSSGRFPNEVRRYLESLPVLGQGRETLSKDDRSAMEIIQAATRGDIPKMRKLAKRLEREGKSVEEVTVAFNRSGPLHLAAWFGRLEMCKFLIKDLHLDVNALGNCGATPLIFAMCPHGSIAAVRLLLYHGANPNITNRMGYTALHTAASIGAYVDTMSPTGTPLHHAAESGNVRMLDLLLRHQANPNRVVSLFYTPLTLAIFTPSLKCVELLIKAGADVNAGRPVTPLVIAATYGLVDFIKCLLEAGADANIPDEDSHLHQSDESTLKARGDAALYTKAMETDPNDSTLYAKRSLCWLHMGEKDKALDDANTYKGMGLDLSNSCHEQGTALILTKEYDQACKALISGLKLDFRSDLIGEVSREENM